MKEEMMVSVIIPTYNRENTLFRAIESVLNQTYSNIEVIVVDDNSNDKTEEMVRKIQDNRIRYLKNNINKGPSGARNVGIKAANGKYIAFQDSDDIWLPSKLEEQLNYLWKNKELGMVYCAFEYNKGNLQYKIPSDKFNHLELEGNIFQTLLECNKISTQTMLIKKYCFDKVGFFNEEIRALEDWELALRIAKNYQIGYVNKTLVKVFFSKDSVNFNTKNLLEANIYIANHYLTLADKRVRLKNTIIDIINQILDIPDKLEQLKYIDMIIPNIISGELEYEVIADEIERTKKFRDNYNLAIGLLDLCNSEEKLNHYFKEKNVKTISIYGTGKIGCSFINICKKANVEIKYAIDQNENHIDGIKIIKKQDIKNDVDMIIVTIPNAFQSIKKDLENKTCAEIICLSSILI